MNNIIEFVYKFFKKQSALICIMVALLVVVADYLTGAHIRFSILFVIPAILAAWQNRKATAYAIAIILPLTRLTFYLPWHQTEPLFVMSINALIRIAALMFIVHLIDRTASQAKKLKILEGLLPICASCKRIRNEKGDYEQMERYVTDHSEASFSHGICPECTNKLYPGLHAGRKE